MRGRRVPITIAGLMVGVAFGSLGLACLMYASSSWAKAALSVALGILTLAILGVILRRGERRAYWTGFAVCGWMYLVLSDSPWLSASIRHRLVTTEVLSWSYPLLVPESRRPEGYGASHQVVSVPGAILGKGITMANLSSTRRIDVWAKMSDGTRSLMAEDAEFLGLSNSGNTVTVQIEVHRDEATGLSQAQAARASFVIEAHDPGLFSGLRSSPPVRSDDLQTVGHPLFALLFAWLGSIAGRFFFTPTEPTGTSGSRSASPGG